MVRSIIAAAGFLAVASAGVAKRATPLADSCQPGWKYNECIEITSGFPVIGDDPTHFTDGYTPEACQAFCMKHKKAGKSIKYAAVTADFCECYGDELMGHKETMEEGKCKSPCPGKDDFYCGSYVDGTPGQWYYAVYECSDDEPQTSDTPATSDDYQTTTDDYETTTDDYQTTTDDYQTTTSDDYQTTTSDDYPQTTQDHKDHHKHPKITSTVYETVVETITKCPETVTHCPHKKTKTITTTTCYDASMYTKSYDETVTVTECPKTVVDCPYKHKPTTSVKPCSSVVTYDPSASYVCGNDLCAKPYPTKGVDSSSPSYPGCSGKDCGHKSDGSSSPSYPSCSGKDCNAKSSNSSYPVGSSGCTGKDCYHTAGAAREGVLASVALVAGLGLGVAALF